MGGRAKSICTASSSSLSRRHRHQVLSVEKTQKEKIPRWEKNTRREKPADLTSRTQSEPGARCMFVKGKWEHREPLGMEEWPGGTNEGQVGGRFSALWDTSLEHPPRRGSGGLRLKPCEPSEGSGDSWWVSPTALPSSPPPSLSSLGFIGHLYGGELHVGQEPCQPLQGFQPFHCLISLSRRLSWLSWLPYL